MHSLFMRRFGALTAAALVATAVTAVAAPAQAATVDTGPVNAGAAWLTAQIQPNGLLTSQYGTDYWTSADAALAQFATGHTSDGNNIVTALNANIDHYVSNVDGGFGDEFSAGATAKAVVLEKLAGIDPSTVTVSDGKGGSTNLLGRLESLVSPDAADAGRIQDTVDPADQYGADYGNVLGQAFAVRALSEQSAPQADSALAYLLKQQCEPGYFRVYFTADKTATDQTCDGGLPTTGASYGDNSDPSVDATAYAIIELSALPQTTATSRAIGKAEAWLMSMQNDDGSFGADPTLPGANADSTGLAGWALGLSGDAQSANAAAVWIRAHQAQNVAPCADALSSQAGAIAHDGTALAHGRTAGIPAADAYSWNLSTAQALPALNYYTPSAPASALKAVATTAYVQAKTRTSVTISGLVAGAPACVTLGTTHVSLAAGLSGSAAASLLMPAGTANRSVSVTDGATTASVFIKVLDAKTLTLTPSTLRPRHGTSFTLRVSGMARNERVTVSYAGRIVLRGYASSTGTYAHAIAAGSSLGNKALVVTGQFSNRKGTKTITVVR